MTSPQQPRISGSALVQQAQDAECAEMAEAFPSVTFDWAPGRGFRARFPDGSKPETADAASALRILVRLRLHGRLG